MRRKSISAKNYLNIIVGLSSAFGKCKKTASYMMLFVMLLSATQSIYGQTGTWTALTNLAPSGHFNGGVMLLLPDGSVMVKTSAGGTSGGVGITWDKLTPSSTGSYAAGTWSTLATMTDDRLYFSSQVMRDGRVYVAGGEYSWSGGTTGTSLTPTAKGEVYNMVTNSWAAVPTYSLTISDANSAMLPSGKILQAAVASTLKKTFIYDPATNTAVAGPSSAGIHNESAWVTLPDNSVLFVDRLATTSERYIPSSNTWISDASLPVGLYDPFGDECGAAFLLPNGNAFFIGSLGLNAVYTPSGSTSAGTWASAATTPNIPGGSGQQGAPDAAAAMMVNGKILMAVSPVPRAGDHFPDSTVFYEYDYASNSFALTNGPYGGSIDAGIPCYITNMLCLPNGQILFAYQGDRQYFVYTPGSSALSSSKPTITSVSRTNCDTFTVYGTQFNGISEGASYGDDWQMSSNYPIVRLTSGSTVKYARTYNWNRQGAVATGSALDTAGFILPSGFTHGAYTLEVVANGNPSSGFSINTSLDISPATSTLCPSSVATLTPTWTGGAWTSCNSAIVTVGSSTGIITAVATGTACISYTLSGACVAVATVNVTSSLSSITGPTSVCVGSTITLSNSTGGGVWSSSAPGTASVGTSSGVVTGVASGTATITYSIGGCFATYAITVNPLATPGTISGTPTVCVGATTTLTASGTGGGTWTSTNTAVGTVSSSGVVMGISGGTTTISYTVTNGCGPVAATQIVTVNALATPGTISGTPTVCVGATTALTASGTSGGTWTSTNTAVGTVSSSGVVRGIAGGTTTISYTVTNSCGSVAATQVVTVNPLATPGTISGTPTVCVGATTTLTASGTGGGTWSSTNTAVGTVSSGGVVGGVSAGTTTISYTVTNSCGSVAATQVVTVNPLATPGTISGTPTVCVGATTALTASGTGGGTWSSTSPAIGTVSLSGVVAGISVGTTTISYTVTNSCGSVAATQVVTVNPLPGTITGTASMCVGASTTLSCSPSGGTWSSSNVTIALVGTGTGIVTGVSAGTANIMYTLSTGCFTTITVTVIAAPSTITGGSAVCAGSTITLSSTPSGGSWSSSNTGLATVGSGTGIVNGISSGVANITYTLSGGCFATHPVTVTTAPGAISGTATVCTSLTTTLTCTPSGGLWTSSATGTASVNSTTGVVAGVAAGTATITYSLGTGCESYITVTVNAGPATISGASTVCDGSTITLTSSPSGGTWSSSILVFATVGSGSGVVTGIASGVTVITYLVGSCYVTHPVTVVSTPGAISGTTAVCVGATTTLSASPAGGLWTSGATGTATVNSTSGVVTGVATGTANITYSMGSGCQTITTVTVNSNPAAITGTFVLCIGSSTGFSSATTGGNWSSSNSGIANVGAGTGIVSAVSVGVANITYTLGTGCVAVQAVTVTALPTITLGASPVILSGATTGNLPYTATSGSPATYSIVYSGVALGAGFANVTGAALSSTPIVLTVPAGAPVAIYTGTLTVTNGSCTSTNYSFTVTINSSTSSAPVFTGGSPQSLSACAFPIPNPIDTLLRISDPDVGEVETWTVISGPLHGTITSGGTMVSTGGVITPTGFSYTASYGYLGTDAFTVQVSDGAGGFATTVINVNVYAVPAIVTVTGGGGYCSGGAGVNVGLSGSAIGINYQLYLGGVPVGSPVPGAGAALSFGLQTAAGVYTVTASNPLAPCTNSMSGSATVVIYSLPNIYTITGGGGYCAGGSGVAIGLAGSDVGVSYQLYRGGFPVVSTITAGTGSAITFPLQTIAGTYTVIATTGGSTACNNLMSGSVTVTVNPLPGIYTVTGGGGYCAGGTGVHIGLSNSNTGINYQLYLGTTPVGSPLAGTGLPLDFGLFTTAGTYTVIATNATTACVRTMSGSATVIVNPIPTAFTVTGGGGYCTGGAGIAVGLSNSTFGISYQLFNGTTAMGSPVGGTGGAISFGLQTVAGTYTVAATNTTTGCTNNMSGSVTVAINLLPTVYTVTGGGLFCAGGPGVAIGLSSSDAGINYQLYRGTMTIGGPIGGTGGAISFGLQTIAGSYTVVAYNPATGCSSNMSGTAVITISPLPTIVTITGGGGYCVGGAGVNIGLAGSSAGISYQLYLGTTAVGSPVFGTGAALSFGLQTAAGTYTATATNPTSGCTSTMAGSVTVAIYTLPTAYTVTGGGSYCAGGAGVAIGLTGSDVGTNYQLYLGGVPVLGTVTAGTGSAISFGLRTAAGTYTVVATNGGSTACTNLMTGSVTITINPLPTAYLVTGGGSYCVGGTGVLVGLISSDFGVNYQLYRGTVAVGAPITGTGFPFDFPPQTTPGTYIVIATDPTTGCTNTMIGSVTITVNPLPFAFTVTGGGSYCPGGSGVAVGLAGTTFGTNYQLYVGTTAVGSPVAGTGATITFGLQTTAGTYTVIATNTTTGCTNTMAGSVTVTIIPLPTAFTVTGGGSYCAGGTGVHIYLSTSATGVVYQLFRGTVMVGTALTGTGSSLDFGLQTIAGTYTVQGTATGTLCTNNMTGSVTVTIDPLPLPYTVTGGGGYCAGDTGVHIYLITSDAGVNYQLYRGTTVVGSPLAGTGATLDFGLQTTAGIYTITGTDATTGCVGNMAGSVTVTINPLPTAYTMTGGGSYCVGGIGVPIYLSSSQTGVSYQLYLGTSPVGGPVTGTGLAITFGLQTAAGTYTVAATNTTTGCKNDMAGTITVSINPLPNAYTVTGGGSYCAGGTGVVIGLIMSDAGVNYQLYRGTVSVGSAVAGTGAAISFGSQTVAGTYTVQATNTTTGCTNTMTGSATVVINPLPAVVTITGGGGYCTGGAGVNIGLVSSAMGINYQLYLGTTAVGSPVAGTGTVLSFGLQTTAGTYTAKATNPATGCTSNMAGSVTVAIYSLPTVYTMTGGGSYCSGGTGVAIGLSGSSTGTNYQLYRGGLPIVGTTIAGTGAALSFGLQTIAGTYTVVATNGGSTGCSVIMSGSAVITINPLPTAYSVTGGGGYCVGGSGVHIYLSNSDAGVNYQLYRGTVAVGSPLAGTGTSLDFGLHTTAGTYTVRATNTSTGCNGNMSGSATVTINPLPAAFTVTGGGSYCAGGSGVAVGLSGSVYGISYQLYAGTTPTGSPLTGTGATLSFGLQTTGGVYTVVATNTLTGCTNTMTGSATVTVLTLPTAYTVTGGGSYCSGGTGVHIGLSGSSTGVTYRLYRGTILVSSAFAGTGSPIDFGLYNVAGTYTVIATLTGTSCASNMTGSAVITISALPNAYTVTGGGGYCIGGSGVVIGLASSQTGVTYQLYMGTTVSGTPVAGTGSAISFGLRTVAGTYTVVATDATTGCTRTMTGSVTVLINPLPTAYTVTGGGSYCAGGSGRTVGLAGSQTGVSYQLFLGSTSTGSPVSGSGGAISFGLQTAAGTYTVVGTRTSTGCTSTMSGSVAITINPLPNVDTVTGGGGFCSGGTGVAVGLNGSTSGVNYQLYRGTVAVGSAMAGTGSSLSFGLFTTSGTYTVIATNPTTGCTRTMAGSAVVTANPVPALVSVTGGGGYCSGGAGVHIGLAASAVGINYQLYMGTVPIGSPVAGTGTAIDFGLFTAAGTYTVVASYATTSCSRTMSGSATVTVYALPTVYSVTGGGSYCSGGSGVHVYLSGSNTGVTYRLYRGGTPVGGPVSGTGSAIDFGLFTTAGTYTVVATISSTGCTAAMSGSAVITINPLPTVSGSIYTVAPAATITLTGTPGGGTWSSSLTSVATIGATTGIVTGVTLGTAVMTYTLSTGCYNTHIINVTATGHRDAGSTADEPLPVAGSDMSVIPNPNKGTFTIKGNLDTDKDAEVSIRITDMVGRIVYSSNFSAHNGAVNELVSFGNIKNGLYLLNLQTVNGNKVFRITIER